MVVVGSTRAEQKLSISTGGKTMMIGWRLLRTWGSKVLTPQRSLSPTHLNKHRHDITSASHIYIYTTPT